MAEVGQVISKQNNMVTVRLQRVEACAKCRACTMGMKKEEMLISAQNLCQAEIGDFVHVELKEGVFLKAVLMMYGFPLTITLFGFLLGSLVNELFGFLLGLICLLVSFLVIKSKERTLKTKSFVPMAVSLAQTDYIKKEVNT